MNSPGGGILNKIGVHSAAANYVSVLLPTLTNEVFGTLTYFREDLVAKTPSAYLRSTANYPYNGVFDNGSQDIPQFGTMPNTAVCRWRYSRTSPRDRSS